MKITQDVRDYAATLNDPAGVGAVTPHPEEARSAVSKDEAEQGMRDMSKKFLDMGAKVYVEAEKVKESNKAL
jgi:phosphomethylpyrimidine synthase